MKGKRNESLSLRLFNNGKDVKKEKENKGVSHTSFEVQRKKKEEEKKNKYHQVKTTPFNPNFGSLPYPTEGWMVICFC